MQKYMKNDEVLIEFGRQLRTVRLRQNLDQRKLASQAGVSLHALQNLENGRGASMSTLVKILAALERTDWLLSLSPQTSFSPLQMLKARKQRQRVSRPRKKTDV